MAGESQGTRRENRRKVNKFSLISTNLQVKLTNVESTKFTVEALACEGGRRKKF